jgi:hypothetical protein
VPLNSHLSWSGEAFGLSIRSAIPLPGLVRGVQPAGTRPLVIRIAKLDPRLADRGVRVAERRDKSGELTRAIGQDEDGYGISVRGAGLYKLTSDGQQVTCAPPMAGAMSVWRDYLMGQVLPFAALLQGVEVFRASAVELDGAVLALAGGTGLGKSTLALNLHLGGARFVTDDVVAVELQGGEVVVQPGLASVKVRRAATDAVDFGQLGSPVSSSAEEVRYVLDAARTSLPLGTFCLLERSLDGSLKMEEMSDPARALLASSFNFLVTTPERLAGHLGVCAAIASRARVVRVFVPERPDAAIAAQLRSSLSGEAAATAR